jgi:hypothetical protein
VVHVSNRRALFYCTDRGDDAGVSELRISRATLMLVRLADLERSKN